MVGPAGDTKLSAFRNMCFSKSPHFGNRGGAPGAAYQSKLLKIKVKWIKTTHKNCLKGVSSTPMLRTQALKMDSKCSKY